MGLGRILDSRAVRRRVRIAALLGTTVARVVDRSTSTGARESGNEDSHGGSNNESEFGEHV
jgi:hypothetical protein